MVRSALERAIARDRLAVLAGLAGVALLAWIYLSWMALDMYGAMTGPSAWMMRASWTPAYALLTLLMWIVMMAGMMLPSATPAILLYARIARSGEAPWRPVLRTNLFMAGYMIAWTAFSLAATLLQGWLATRGWISPMLEARGPLIGTVLLLAAGIYQLTAFKRSCLDRCRSPAQFIVQHMRPGARGALRLGLLHGAYCVGCCAGLMLLLFFGGVMSLVWIAAISLFVLLEKLAPFGAGAGRISGVLLIAAAAILGLGAV